MKFDEMLEPLSRQTLLSPTVVSHSLQWEINWINNNVGMYDSPMHAQAVIGNIVKRHRIDELTEQVRRLSQHIGEW